MRAADLRCRRIGLVRRSQTARTALEYDAVDETTTDAAEALEPADLVILATPLAAFPRFMEAARQHCRPGTLLTDVGSTKRLPQQWASRHLGRKVRYIGSHPMAGGERTGVEFARADLFHGATCFVCPTRRRDDPAAVLLRQLWEAFGGRVVFVSPARHDRLVARISHVPHLAAAALVHLAGSNDWLDAAGPGLRDTTRIASGNPAMWRDILQANRKEVTAGLEEFIQLLTELHALLKDGRDDATEAWLRRAARRRDAWLGRLLDGGRAGD